LVEIEELEAFISLNLRLKN